MLKYILFGNEDDIPRVVIFDTITDHSKIAREVNLPVISAGRISGEWNCTTGSVTLQINYNADRSAKDTDWIKRLRNLN